MTKLSSTVEKITPAQAELWLEKNFARQRNMRQWQVDFLAEQMKKGRFMPTAQVGIAHVNGDTCIVNGQHTLWAILESGQTQHLPVVRHFVDSEDELNDIYAHYDIGIKRSFTDSVRTYRVSENVGLSETHVNKLASAIRFIESGFGAGRIPRMAHEDLIAKVVEWTPFMKSLQDTMHPCSTEIRNRLESRAILSVAIVTVRHQPEKANLFWGGVARDDGLERGDPRKALNKKLLMISALTGNQVGGNDIMIPGIQSRIAAHSWNKWFRGKSLIVIKDSMFSTGEEIKIEGTAYA